MFPHKSQYDDFFLRIQHQTIFALLPTTTNKQLTKIFLFVYREQLYMFIGSSYICLYHLVIDKQKTKNQKITIRLSMTDKILIIIFFLIYKREFQIRQNICLLALRLLYANTNKQLTKINQDYKPFLCVYITCLQILPDHLNK